MLINKDKETSLDRLALELEDMQCKVQVFYEEYKNKDNEQQVCEKELLDIKADKFKLEIDLAKEKQMNEKLNEQVK